MGQWFLILVLRMFYYFLTVSGNSEGDALNAFKNGLIDDPNGVLTSWDSTLVNPCTWFHITCDNNNSVTRIDLGDMNLTGQLVPQLGSLPNLEYLNLSSNNISGKIPSELGNLTSLMSLNLYQNKLSGPIPDELGKLSRLRFLLLNNNTLSGAIPMSLTTINTLQVLDLSFNNLSGYIPVNGSFSILTPIRVLGNPHLKSTPVAPELPLDHLPLGPPTPEDVSIGAIAAAAAAVAAVLFSAALIAALICREIWRAERRREQDHYVDVSAENDPEIHMGALHWFSPRALNTFSLKELQVATDNFDPQNLVGRGGFGEVYKGCLADGSLVAVKRLKDVHNKVEALQFQAEVEMISLVNHPNLLRLQGFCMTRTEKLLVYPYMANGSLASCLRGSQLVLEWPKRKRIALGSARGLAYLHHQFDPKIIHCDVKAANVLLDDEFEAVVGDFGLAELMDRMDTHVTTIVRGTIGHIAPEYYSNGKCSEKTDIFGYGVMLLELISGQKTTQLGQLAIEDGFVLHDWVKGLVKEKKLERLVDGHLEGNYVEEEAEQLAQVAVLCTQSSPMQRPTMYEVVTMLQGKGLPKRWEEWQKQEAFWRESNHALLPNVAWIVDSTSKLRPDKLSGPR